MLRLQILGTIALVLIAPPLMGQSITDTARDTVPGAEAATAPDRVSLEQAISEAIAHGGQVPVTEADRRAAAAAVTVAREWPNPTVALSATKSPPTYHATIDFPFEYPSVRRARTGAAQAALEAGIAQVALTRATVRYVVEVAYVQASVASQRAELSLATANGADTLAMLARVRRDAGDASELDVELASLNAAQLRATALTDSVQAVLALLDVQALMGRPADRVRIALSDTLSVTTPYVPVASTPLSIAAARATLSSTERTVAMERALRVPAPALELGVEWHDPTGDERGVLPIVGISFPVPLFSRHKGAIAVAEANRDRARAELLLAQRQYAANVARAQRERAAAIARAEIARQAMTLSSRAVAKALIAYREGASALPFVLDVQRNARDVTIQFLDAITAARTADAAVRLATTPATQP
jgi:cobalt-zinc-cadmium efflux system outer membrane protein